MRKTHLILLFLVSSFIFGQKEIPEPGSSLENIGDWCASESILGLSVDVIK